MNLKQVITVQNYYTKNDASGNPRRISITKEDFSHKSYRQVAERYLKECIDGERDKDYIVIELTPVEVPVKQYKDLVNS
jgi:hypothetical protein